MSKCQTCMHYHYYAGVAATLSKLMGKEYPTEPTNYCSYAKVSWRRNSAEVRKPKGVSCSYTIKEMYCNDCEKLLKNSKDVWMILTSKSYICKECGNEKEAKNKKGE